jgi:hypothetical protein
MTCAVCAGSISARNLQLGTWGSTCLCNEFYGDADLDGDPVGISVWDSTMLPSVKMISWPLPWALALSTNQGCRGGTSDVASGGDGAALGRMRRSEMMRLNLRALRGIILPIIVVGEQSAVGDSADLLAGGAIQAQMDSSPVRLQSRDPFLRVNPPA